MKYLFTTQYDVGVDNNDKLSVSDGVVSGGVVNKYWDSKQTEDAINSAYWTASDGKNDIRHILRTGRE